MAGKVDILGTEGTRNVGTTEGMALCSSVEPTLLPMEGIDKVEEVTGVPTVEKSDVAGHRVRVAELGLVEKGKELERPRWTLRKTETGLDRPKWVLRWAKSGLE